MSGWKFGGAPAGGQVNAGVGGDAAAKATGTGPGTGGGGGWVGFKPAAGKSAAPVQWGATGGASGKAAPGAPRAGATTAGSGSSSSTGGSGDSSGGGNGNGGAPPAPPATAAASKDAPGLAGGKSATSTATDSKAGAGGGGAAWKFPTNTAASKSGAAAGGTGTGTGAAGGAKGASGTQGTALTTQQQQAQQQHAQEQLQKGPPAEYATKTVEEIVNEWSDQLRQDADEFIRKAKRVSEWDALLLHNLRAMQELADQVHRLEYAQRDLVGKLEAVEGFQRDLDATLHHLDKQIDERFDELSEGRPKQCDVERERIYHLAITVDQQLEMVRQSLCGIVSQLNEPAGNAAASSSSSSMTVADSDNPVGQIVRVLNAHHQTLSYLDMNARQLQGEVSAVHALLTG